MLFLIDRVPSDADIVVVLKGQLNGLMKRNAA